MTQVQTLRIAPEFTNEIVEQYLMK